MTRPLACVEHGGSGSQTIVLDRNGWRAIDGAHRPADADLAIAVPGIIEAGRVVAASNIGWYDVDPAEALGLPGPAALVLNDAEAAAIGESVLRACDGVGPDLAFVGLGTGVGGAVVHDGVVVATNLLGHAPGFSERPCPCGRVGCLETVAAGWALPAVLERSQLRVVAAALARAVEGEPLARDVLVVLAGGLVVAHPTLLAAVQSELPHRPVEGSAAPPEAKSASAWGLRSMIETARVVEASS